MEWTFYIKMQLRVEDRLSIESINQSIATLGEKQFQDKIKKNIEMQLNSEFGSDDPEEYVKFEVVEN
ncbi:hypothetical protein HNQ80_003395 [Anaerosolibacter carboniphilus]|uniref:Uncharacterized protein n=1 Tax=Anaerosolibacter carboniphilus TaxID=1417629 RepID=A0A841KUH2_9FIRM|nr:hypothetical protein [Anaerosolibacter carboniphilus]MBB6217276.1 hypothetical protein [Anaerosolibacter carboniphilus]